MKRGHPVARPRRRTGRSVPEPSAESIVRTLNDPGRGPLLDALLHARTRLEASGTPSGWERDTLAALAEGLIERLAAAGIEPAARLGERLDLTASALARRYRYLGPPLGPGTRRTKVEVVAPGWRVGGRRVQRPTVRAVEASDR
jgi:hypothetical protein